MLGRSSVLLVATAAVAVAVVASGAAAAAQFGALAPTAPTGAAAMRFAQQRVGSEAPDWWHYVAPWWSPPEHEPTKSPPDFVDQPMYTHYKEPPKDTMGVYVPYGRDAMSSFVETETSITGRRRTHRKPATAAAHRFQQQQQQQQQPMTQPRAMPYAQQYAQQQQQMPVYPPYNPQQTMGASIAQATAPRFSGVYGTPGLPPQLPALPAVPNAADMRAASEFSLPSSLQMSMYPPAVIPQAMMYAGAPGAPMAPPMGASAPAITPAQQKQFEASEDARFARMEDEEFGEHSRLAKAGAPVPRIWRVDRQTKDDLAQEAEFESDADAVQMEADRQAIQESEVEEETIEDANAPADADAHAFRQIHQKMNREQQRQRTEHDTHLAEAQTLRDASASQWDDEAEAAPAAAAAPHAFPKYNAFRFKQLGDADAEEAEAETAQEEEEADEEAVEEQEAEESEEEAGSSADAAAAEGEDSDSEVTEEVISDEEVSEADEAEQLAEEGMAGLDESQDAAVEGEAQALERANDRWH